MHVAHFVHRYPPAVGGAERYVERLGRYLAGCGDDVTVWTSTAVALEEMWQRSFSPPLLGERPGVGLSASPNPPAPFPQREGGGRLVVQRYRPLTFPLRRYVLKAASLVPVPRWQALTLPCNPVCPGMWWATGRFAGPLDAVHAFAFPYAFPAACGLRLARRRQVPFLLTPFLHLGDPTDPRDRTRRQYTSRPLRWLLRQADRVFAQTPSEQQAVIGLGVPAERVVLQGLGVDPAECTGGDRAAARAAWGVESDEVVIGHLANLSAEKGSNDLLRVAEVLWNAGVPVRVVLAGPEMPNFRRVWDTFSRKDRVTKLGPLTDAGKRDFFAGLDAFALPSRSDSFGLVLLEAWANGKPVVAYRAGGPADLVRHGVDGLLARCGDVGELAARLRELVDSARRRALGDAGRERIGEFRWEERLQIVREATITASGGA